MSETIQIKGLYMRNTDGTVVFEDVFFDNIRLPAIKVDESKE